MKIDKPSESELSEKTKLNKDPLKKKKLLIQKQKQKEDVQNGLLNTQVFQKHLKKRKQKEQNFLKL